MPSAPPTRQASAGRACPASRSTWSRARECAKLRAAMLQIFKRNFLTGLAVTLPVAGALWIFISIATWVDDIFPDAWRPKVFHHPLPGLGLVVATIVILGVGSLARNFLGQQLISWGDKVVEHIPVFGKTYGLLKQIVQAVFGKQRDTFRRAVLV